VIIKIDEALRNKIQRYQYETEARKELIGFIATNPDLSSNQSEILARYEKEYMEFFKLYNEAKTEMINIYLKDITYKSWNLDFYTCELTVEI
jgi:hypothetical protein